MLSRDAHDLVVAAEFALLQTSVRGDPTRLEGLLSEDFREIGASGRLFDRAEILAELSGEHGDELEASMTEAETRHVADELVLLTYLLSAAGRTSRRSSLWRLGAEGPRIVFHQGTVVT